jgi:hypothetical protein
MNLAIQESDSRGNYIPLLTNNFLNKKKYYRMKPEGNLHLLVSLNFDLTLQGHGCGIFMRLAYYPKQQ